jgi:hypothetical protein
MKLFLSNRDPRLLSLGLFFFVALLGFLFDRLLVVEGLGRTAALLLTNSLTAATTAVAFYRYELQRKQEQDAVRERMQVISEMNHHVRNALQVITFFGAQQKDRDSVALIRDSVERIEWTLREVLPRYAPPTTNLPQPHA